MIEPRELIHFDLCEVDDMLTRNCKRNVITFSDDCSDFTFIYLLKNKSDAFYMFRIFVIEVENQLNKKLLQLKRNKY